jgi:hypothetical protein
VAPSHVQSRSKRHTAEQRSPSTWPPSSQSSPASTTPLPQSWQVGTIWRTAGTHNPVAVDVPIGRLPGWEIEALRIIEMPIVLAVARHREPVDPWHT